MMTRLIVPVMAVGVVLAGVPAWAQGGDQKAAGAPAAAGTMKCGTMAGGAQASNDVVAKLTAKKKDLKLNDKQIQQIAAALAAGGQEGMCMCMNMMQGGAMPGMMQGHQMMMKMGGDDKAAPESADHAERQHQ